MAVVVLRVFLTFIIIVAPIIDVGRLSVVAIIGTGGKFILLPSITSFQVSVLNSFAVFVTDELSQAWFEIPDKGMTNKTLVSLDLVVQ